MPQDQAVWASRAVPAVLSGVLALYFLARGFGAQSRSRRLANWALFCGVTAFALFERVGGLAPPEHRALFRVVGAVRLAVGLCGIGLGIASFVARRSDHGTGVVRPVLGLVLSVMHAGVGGSFLLLSSSLYAPPGSPGDSHSSPWDYPDPESGLVLTLPSSNWRPMTMKSGKVLFVQTLPRMQAGFLDVAAAPDEAAFRRAAEAHERYARSEPSRAATIRKTEGTNAHGNRYVYLAGMDKTEDGKDIFVGSSMTWCAPKGKMALVIFEGVPTMTSQAGRDTERATMEASAESVCLSVH